MSATSLLAHADLADSAEAGVNETFAICVRNLYSAYANPADARENALPRAEFGLAQQIKFVEVCDYGVSVVAGLVPATSRR